MIIHPPSVGQPFSDHFEKEDEFRTTRQVMVDELVYLQLTQRSSSLTHRTVLPPIIETAFCQCRLWSEMIRRTSTALLNPSQSLWAQSTSTSNTRKT